MVHHSSLAIHVHIYGENHTLAVLNPRKKVFGRDPDVWRGNLHLAMISVAHLKESWTGNYVHSQSMVCIWNYIWLKFLINLKYD